MTSSGPTIEAALEPLVTGDFAGVVSVSVGDDLLVERAYGLADRAHEIVMTVKTRCGIASGSKGFTALMVRSLVTDGALSLDSTARSLLGDDLPLIADDVTVEHLLTHTSGIGDYLNEDGDIDDYALSVPMQELATTEQFLAVLDGFPTAFPAGESFAYCNGGYVVLALLAERASGRSFHDLVRERVLVPADMTATDFLRTDSLPGDVAINYLTDGRSNIFHLPVLANGDGGAYSTVRDFRQFWRALFAGDIVTTDVVADMVRPRNSEEGFFRCGAGFFLRPTGSAVFLEGCDAGVSFRSVHDPESGMTHTVMATISQGAWPISRRLNELLDV
jgi:CubicO group peptidase (beta-lactamase class C family)